MRTITDHVVNPDSDRLSIVVIDEPGSGGAHHHYIVECNENEAVGTEIRFQNGPIAVLGVNGLTHEALLAIVADRLTCFQAGPYPSMFNAEALGHVNAALEALKGRTRERMNRGVEGTLKA